LNLTLVVDCLFKVYERMLQNSNTESDTAMAQDEYPLKIGFFLKQLRNFQIETEYPILHHHALIDCFSINTPVNKESKSSKTTYTISSISGFTTDGTYAFLHSKDQGLVIVGTGRHNTVRGYIYKS